jgi:plasmid stabilization system protein ParE
MTSSVHVTLAAEQDLTAAFIWYEEQSASLGDEFIDQVSDLIARVAETPRQFPEVMSGYRRGLLHRFPYGVYFSVESDRVVVRAILHLHRDAAHWRDRLS